MDFMCVYVSLCVHVLLSVHSFMRLCMCVYVYMFACVFTLYFIDFSVLSSTAMSLFNLCGGRSFLKTKN